MSTQAANLTPHELQQLLLFRRRYRAATVIEDLAPNDGSPHLTQAQAQRLLFVRWLVRTDRLTGDTEAEGTPLPSRPRVPLVARMMV
jgi:hypothetical protein